MSPLRSLLRARITIAAFALRGDSLKELTPRLFGQTGHGLSDFRAELVFSDAEVDLNLKAMSIKSKVVIRTTEITNKGLKRGMYKDSFGSQGSSVLRVISCECYYFGKFDLLIENKSSASAIHCDGTLKY